MDQSPNQTHVRDKNKDLSPPSPPSTNGDGTSLASSLQRLSLGTASSTPLPNSPMKTTPNKVRDASTGNSAVRSQSPYRRPTSSASVNNDRRSSTPLLHKKASISSLQNVGGVTPPRPSLSRRTSSNMLNSSSTTSGPKSPLATKMPEHTPASVAKEHFEKEMALHKDLTAKTVVIVHDSCYGHRYSRPRTSKNALNTIVERPERILASVLGVAAAYVRLGGRHHEGRYAPHPNLDLDLLRTPPFQIQKTTRTVPLSSPAVTLVHGNKWMEELKNMCDSAESKLALNGKELVRVAGGKEDDNRKLHEGDLYLCSESLNAFEAALGAVCDGVDAVLSPNQTRRAFVAIRPPGHHCAADYPSGFCWLNNVHVGITHAAMTHGLTHAAIIDFDLHHGDGSQAITWDHNRRISSLPRNAPPFKKTPIGYFSLHDINSYPCEMGEEEKIRSASVCIDNAHGQSIWNVHLQHWKNAQEFWRHYETKYTILIEKARLFLRTHSLRLMENSNGHKPKAAIFLSAGFDASEWEGAAMQRHKVNVPTDFYAKFTSDVVRLAEEEGLGVDGRIISVLEGGYSDRALTSGVLSHLSGLANVGSDSYHDNVTSSRLASEMQQRMGLNGVSKVKEEGSDETFVSFDTDWWSKARLEELELLVHPPPPPPAPKKPKEKLPPTYSSPTQAWNMKRISSAPSRRSVSGTPAPDGHEHYEPLPIHIPDVDWATAAHELSKILIPSDRSTTSCKHEDLNAEATRARKERYSTVGVPAAPVAEEGKRMQLRERKAKPPPSYTLEEERAASRASRRTTIAAADDLPDPSLAGVNDGTMDFSRSVVQQRRRSSAASSITSSVSGLDRPPSVVSTAPSQKQSGLELGKVRNGATSSANSAQSDRTTMATGVKKTRVASGGARAKPSTGRNSPNKAPPVPRMPTAYREPTPAPSAARDSKPEVKAEGKGDGAGAELDSLASKMKKMSIKLNLPPEEEQRARDKAMLEDKKKPAARVPRKPAAPRTTKPVNTKAPAKTASKPTQPAAVQPAVDAVPTDAVSSAGERKPIDRPVVPAESLPSPPLSSDAAEGQPPPPNAPILHHVEPVLEDTKMETAVPEQPPTFTAPTESVPAPVAPTSPPRHALPTQGRSSGIPTNSPPTSRHNLPVFTSTSAIQFGTSKAAAMGIGSGIGNSTTTSSSYRTGQQGSPPSSAGSGSYRAPEKDYVPYRPEPGIMGIVPTVEPKPAINEFSGINGFGPGYGHGIGDVHENGIDKSESGVTVKKEEDGNSIWEVPETPQH